MGKVIRILTGLIDFIIAYLALYLVMTLLGVQETSRDLLAQVLYILYGVIFSSSFSGKTIGRFFGHLHLDYYRSDRFFLCLISREVSKMLYFLPAWIGWFFIAVTLVLFAKQGRYLHDIIGQTYVKVDEAYE